MVDENDMIKLFLKANVATLFLKSSLKLFKLGKVIFTAKLALELNGAITNQSIGRIKNNTMVNKSIYIQKLCHKFVRWLNITLLHFLFNIFIYIRAKVKLIKSIMVDIAAPWPILAVPIKATR